MESTLHLIEALFASTVGQIVLLCILAVIAIVIFGVLLKSVSLSFHLFLYPGTIHHLDSKKKYILGTIQIIVGIVFVGAIASVLTNYIMDFTENAKLREHHSILKEAFETQNEIRNRSYLKQNDLHARLRYLNLEEAQIRLEIGKEDIVKAIREFGQSRLRLLRDTKEVVVEDFYSNNKYGSFIDRRSPITIISTQNYSDAGVGHFASSLAESLQCNYLSNEFFSSGAPLKSKHINFAQNEAYRDFKVSYNSPLGDFIHDLKSINSETHCYIIIGVANTKSICDIHLMFRGDAQNPFQSKNATFSNLQKLSEIYQKLSTDLARDGFKLGTHEEFKGDNPLSLPNALHNTFAKDSIFLNVSTRILWNEDDISYYSAMNDVAAAIRSIAAAERVNLPPFPANKSTD